jgi:hypothetical protein
MRPVAGELGLGSAQGTETLTRGPYSVKQNAT